jgi:transposase
MKIMMDNKEARCIAVIEQTREGKFNNREAAQLLGRSIRQVQRLKRKAEAGGASAVLHGNRGRRPHNALPAETRSTVLSLAKSRLNDYNYLHMQEVLEDEHGVKISYSSLSRLLKSEQVETPVPKRRRRKHPLRKAREHFGELVQLDASKFDWFGDSSYAHLHGAIDDATNRPLALYFTKEESSEAYCELVFQINKAYGLPKEFYADGRTMFFYDSKTKHKLTLEEQLAGIEENMPQFARACKTTGITLTRAHSPQAKGLIERLWGTLQERLPRDFLRLGIHNMEQANAYFSKFIAVWNRRHANDPAKPEPLFAPKVPARALKLHFATQEKRILSKGCTFSFQGKKYTFTDPSCPAKPGVMSLRLLRVNIVLFKSFLRVKLTR